MPSSRYAIYWTPQPDSALWQLGCGWLGRDARGDRPAPPRPPALCGIDDLESVTSAPARYGWHATLKAPFRLAEGCGPTLLCEHMQAFCARQRAFSVRLEAAAFNRFVALRPAEPSSALQALADEAVADFDVLRAPLDATQRARLGDLPPMPRRRFERWGYAQVFGDFQFHCTLTDALEDAARRVAWVARAREVFGAALQSPVRIDGAAIFVEPAPGAPLVMHCWQPFGGGPPAAWVSAP